MSSYKLVDADQLDSDLAAIGDAIRSKGGTVEALSFPGEMVSAISAISTGVELNFEVVPNPQPSVAKENTIWVDTDRINNYYFSATQPEGMVDYDVWFHVGTSSTVEFNALKKGGIQVYPLSAKQMVSGALVNKTAMSYQNGAWVKWIPMGALYYEGDERNTLTGGWEECPWIDGDYYAGSVVRNERNIRIDAGDGNGKRNMYFNTSDPIDLSEYNRIEINVLSRTGLGNSDGYVGAYLYINIIKPYGDTPETDGYACIGIPSTGVFSLDVSGFKTGKYYVVICCYGASITFDKVVRKK